MIRMLASLLKRTPASDDTPGAEEQPYLPPHEAALFDASHADELKRRSQSFAPFPYSKTL